MHTTPELTVESIARLDPADARSWERLAELWRPGPDGVINPLLESPPEPAAARRFRLSATEAGRTFNQLTASTPLSLVTSHFRHPAVRALLCAILVLREVDITLPGQGFQVAALVAGRRRAQLCLGGARRLAEGLAASLEEAGGAVWTQAEPSRLLVEQGGVTTMVLADGRSIRAKRCVISGINPGQDLRRTARTGLPRVAQGCRAGLPIQLGGPPLRAPPGPPAPASVPIRRLRSGGGRQFYAHLRRRRSAGLCKSLPRLRGGADSSTDRAQRRGPNTARPRA